MDPAKMALGRTGPQQWDLSVAVRLGVPGRLSRQRDKCRVYHDGLWSVACPERIVVAAVRVGKVRWGIGGRVLHLSPR